MKSLSVLLLSIAINCQAQFFVQQLDQMQVQNPTDFYLITNEGDTVRGILRGVSYTDSLISALTVKVGDEKSNYKVADVIKLAIIPGEDAKHEDIALGKVLQNIDNDEFIKVLPDNGWIFFERIQLPGKQERYQLAQLLNPGFDSKIKVYAHPDASSTGSTSISGITVGGALDNQHYVALAGERPFVIDDFRYRKLAQERLYTDCTLLTEQKLKWKDFAEHVFNYDQKCD